LPVADHHGAHQGAAGVGQGTGYGGGWGGSSWSWQSPPWQAAPQWQEAQDEGPWSWWWSTTYRAWMLSPQVLRSRSGRWAWDSEWQHAVYFYPPH
jgi:hypothetical protein